MSDERLNAGATVAVEAGFRRFAGQTTVAAVFDRQESVAGFDIGFSDRCSSVQGVAIAMEENDGERLRRCGCVPSLELEIVCGGNDEFLKRFVRMSLRW